MTAENLAKFTINGDASVDPVTGNKGYQAAALDVLTLTLEQSPSTVLSVTYSVYDSSSDDSPLASKDAPLLTFTGSGTSSDSPATINGSVELIMPATAAHSWNVRCVVSHSDGPQEYVRQIDIPYSLAGIDIFKSVPGETDEFYARSWSDKFNDYMTYIAAFTVPTLDQSYDAGGAGLGRAVTVDSGAIEFTGSNAADYTLELTNSAAGGVLYVNNTGTGLTVNFRDGGANVFNIADGGDFDLDSADFDLHATGNVTIDSDGAIDIDAAISLDIDCSAGSIGLGTTPVNHPINIGTSGVRKVTVGNASATEVQIDALLVDINAGATGMTVDSGATIDIDATGALSLDAGDNSNFTVTTNSALDKELIIHLENTSTGEGVIGIVSGDRACTSDHFVGISAVGGAGSSVLIGADGTISLDSALVDINAGATGMTVDSGATIDIDATGALSLNSSAGVINIGNDAVNQNINIGTGVSARTITIGQISGTSTSEVEFNADTIDINSDAGGISLVASTGDILLETSAAPALDITIQATGDIDFLANGSVGTSFNEADSGVLTRLALDGFTASSIIGGMNELHSNIQEIHTLAAATLSFNDTSVTSIHVSYTGTGAVTITVDSDQIAIAGRTFTIKDTGLNAAANSITVETEGAEEIEGEANLVMAVDGMSITLQSDGSNLWII